MALSQDFFGLIIIAGIEANRLHIFVAQCGLPSRSAALHKAVRLLKAMDLSAAYEDAWDDWSESGEARVWEPTAADGLID